ncbi:GHKL domain-containing protein [[Clostridium] spiroforme]|nr:GHKL domain-containing protein [Thomasclavelia spiroformis]MBM6879977.1 GHKL domain-containing protein [Thomasclavelia spiroformis]
MNLELIFSFIFQTIEMLIIIFIFQKNKNSTFILLKNILISIIYVLLVKINFMFFSYNIIYLGVSIFVLTSISLCIINLDKLLNIIYFSSYITILTFFIYMLIDIKIRENFLSVQSFSFSSYMLSTFFVVLILALMINIFEIDFSLPYGGIGAFIAITNVFLLFLELWLFEYLKYFNSNYTFLIYLIIGLIFFSNNIIIQYLYNDFHQLTIMSQNNLLSKITDSYIQGIHNEQEKVFKIRHDIKNNLIILQHLINNNQIAEANQVIDEINNHLKYKKYDVYTGNIFIDAYLTNVIVNSQIDVQIKCNDLNDLHYKPDIIAIIINLVDNAVENANHLVNIQIKRKNPNSILIKVSNDCEHDPSKHLKKSKKQGDHGYGLRIVKDVVNQYQGTYLTSYQNGMFTTYVKLNLEVSDEK